MDKDTEERKTEREKVKQKKIYKMFETEKGHNYREI